MKTEKIHLRVDNPDVTLTTYILDDSPEMLNGKSRPGILICPGGAYLNCSDREAEPIAMKFASMGYHAFVLRYTVYSGGNVGFPDVDHIPPVKEEVLYPAQIRDTGLAMLTLREHAAQWKLDPNKIVLCGFSAGAHNVALYSTKWQTEILTEYFHKDKECFRPAAAILGYTLSDYVFMKEAEGKMNPMDAAFFRVSDTAFLGSPSAPDSLLDEVSPARHVTQYCPPMFLWATSEDNLVPVQHSLLMSYALAQEKIPFELHIFESGPHGLGLSTQATAAAKSQMDPSAAKWADLAGCWLEKRFALPLPDLTDYENWMHHDEDK